MSTIRLCVILSLFIAFLGCVSSKEETTQRRHVALSDPFPEPSKQTLFSSYNPIKMKIAAPLTTLFKVKHLGNERFKEFPVKGILYIEDQSWPIQIILKGFSSVIMCPFPKMEITILGNQHQDSIFLEARTFDLNTHCAEEKSNIDVAFKSSFFNHREALLYRLLDLLEMPTYKARPAFVQYKDEDKQSSEFSEEIYQAFFIEDMSSFKKRLNAKEIKGFDPYAGNKNPFTNVEDDRKVDPEDVARIALFNEMIGNYDWFIKLNSKHMRSQNDYRSLWNVKVMELLDGKRIIFPQDFSLAETVTGIVKPSKYEKAFMIVHPKAQEKIKNIFLQKKSEILSLSDMLDPVGKKYYELAINKFFNQIDK